MVKVTPLFTAVGPLRMYGLPESVQVVLEVKIPVTGVEALADQISTLKIARVNRKTIKIAVVFFVIFFPELKNRLFGF